MQSIWGPTNSGEKVSQMDELAYSELGTLQVLSEHQQEGIDILEVLLPPSPQPNIQGMERAVW